MISGKSKVCGVMAYPVEHSMSPLMHNYYSEQTGTDLAYIPLKVEPGCVEAAVKGAYALNFTGLNVTVPHKQEVMKYLAEMRMQRPSAPSIRWYGQRAVTGDIIRMRQD